MPSLKASAAIDTSRLAPAPATPAPAQVAPPPPSAWDRSPYMVCSLPGIAAGSDYFQRQTLPGQALQRTFPVIA